MIQIWDGEIKLADVAIKRYESQIKYCLWSIRVAGIIFIIFVVMGYYLKIYNWANGFIIGFFLMSFISDLNSITIAKSDIDINKLRIVLYNKLKDSYNTYLTSEKEML
jgi:hypothetical protein